jgi:hypothetical protein
MRKIWKGFEYATVLASDDEEGWIALELHRTANGQDVLAARIVFWDAEGQFSLEVRVDEVPLTIVEELIAEAKARITIE